MRILLAGALVALLALPSSAGFTDALDELATAVTLRESTVDRTTRRGRRRGKALRRSETALARDAGSIGADLRALRRCARELRKAFAGDPEFDALLLGGYGSLNEASLVGRDRLAALMGVVGDERLERKLTKGVERYDHHADRAARALAAVRVEKAAQRLRQACRSVAKTEKQLGLAPLDPVVDPPDEPPPDDDPDAVRDVALLDTNPHSASFGRSVSPREFLGGVSAYYFGHST